MIFGDAVSQGSCEKIRFNTRKWVSGCLSRPTGVYEISRDEVVAVSPDGEAMVVFRTSW